MASYSKTNKYHRTGQPAFATMYTGLSQIWQLPYAAEIPATVTVICTFLGAVLCISAAQYNREQTENPKTVRSDTDDNSGI